MYAHEHFWWGSLVWTSSLWLFLYVPGYFMNLLFKVGTEIPHRYIYIEICCSIYTVKILRSVFSCHCVLDSSRKNSSSCWNFIKCVICSVSHRDIFSQLYGWWIFPFDRIGLTRIYFIVRRLNSSHFCWMSGRLT